MLEGLPVKAALENPIHFTNEGCGCFSSSGALAREKMASTSVVFASHCEFSPR